MNKYKNKVLLSKEITSLENYKSIEELVILLSSLHIKNIKKYILRNKYLLDCNIYDLSYVIASTFNTKKNYCIVKRILTKNKYFITSEKDDVK